MWYKHVVSFPHTVQYVRVNHISFSRQNGETVCSHAPCFIQIASFFPQKRYCLQHNTKQLFNVCLKLYHDARCIVKKIPEKFLTEVTFFCFKIICFSFQRCHRPSASAPTGVFLLPDTFPPKM